MAVPSEFLAAGAEVIQDGIDAAFVDDPKTVTADAQGDKTLFAVDPDAPRMEIR